MAYLAEERETLINYDDSSDICYIYTCNKAMMTKLDKLCKSHPDIYKLVKEEQFAKSYTTKKKFISIRAPKVMTASHKAKLQENAKKMQEAQSK